MATGHHLSTGKMATAIYEGLMSSDFPSRGLDKFVLRLPEGMRDKIGVAARTNTRTMNAEIVQRLEASFSSSGEPLLVINKNTAEADIIFELRDSMQSLDAKVQELTSNLTKVIGGEADPADAGALADERATAIFETREMVRAMLGP